MPASIRYRLSRLALDLPVLPDVVVSAFERPAPASGARVFYGMPHVPTASEFAHGGTVKIQRMQERWPNTRRGFSSLYMVSSALPPGASFWTTLARFKGRQVVWNQNGVSYPATESGWAISNEAMKSGLRSADHVFYQSEFCRLSADRFLGPSSGTWEVLHNSVDTRVFLPREDPLPKAPLMLMLGGNQSEAYRAESAVGTLGVLTARGVDARLTITGHLRWRRDARQAHDELRASIEKWKVGERVTLLGPYAQGVAPSVLQSAHILLHTKYNDPCPGIVIEAMACGLPVVYSASGGVPELVGDEAGIGIPAEATFERMIPPEPEPLADAIQRVAASLPDYSARARARAVRMFDIEPWLDRHARIFERFS